MELEQIEGTPIDTVQTDNEEAQINNESDIEAGGAENGNDGGAGEDEADIEIPSNWEQDIKDFITGISDKSGRKVFFDKFKKFDDGYQKKFGELSEQRKTFEADRKAFEDDRKLLGEYAALEKHFNDSGVSSDIYAQFGSVPNYLKALHQLNVKASKEPAQFILEFCQGAGIDSVEKLEELLTGQAAQDVKRQQAETNLRREFQQQVNDAIQRERERVKITAEVAEFQKTHPYFDALRAEMAALSKRMPEATLAELYDLAVHRNPTVMAQMQLEATEAKKAEEAAEVAKAKNAIGVPKGPAVKSVKSQSWEDFLAQQMANDTTPDY